MNWDTPRQRDGIQVRDSRRCFELYPEKEQKNTVKASTEATAFLVAHYKRLAEDSCYISTQSDQQGQYSDVRDIVVHNARINVDVSISTKHRHFATKHSRISERIDFSSDWFGIRCSDRYFHLYFTKHNVKTCYEIWLTMCINPYIKKLVQVDTSERSKRWLEDAWGRFYG